MIRTAVVVVALAFPSTALAHGIPDQVNDGSTSMSVSCESAGQPLFQSFTPAVRQLVAVDLKVEPLVVRPAPGAAVVLRVVRGVSAGSQLVGTATAFTTGSIAPYLLHFDFATPLVLEPQGPYGLEVPAVPNVAWFQTETDSYARGSSSACGIPYANRDFLFRTLAAADTRAPDTILVRAPSLAKPRTYVVVVRGEDDLTYPSELTFRCELDGQPLACAASTTVTVGAGAHRLTAAAVDRAGNVDPTPAVVEWTVDVTPPPKPQVRGPRRAKAGVATYRLSSTGATAFICQLDRRPSRRCGATLRLRLARGTHVLRVQAIDADGNVSAATTVRIRAR